MFFVFLIILAFYVTVYAIVKLFREENNQVKIFNLSFALFFTWLPIIDLSVNNLPDLIGGPLIVLLVAIVLTFLVIASFIVYYLEKAGGTLAAESGIGYSLERVKLTTIALLFTWLLGIALFNAAYPII